MDIAITLMNDLLKQIDSINNAINSHKDQISHLKGQKAMANEIILRLRDLDQAEIGE
jgi:hypothetical protein